jgi:hypothetical protein
MDERPVVFCRRCVDSVVMMPNGICPWCDYPIRKPSPRAQVERLHRERLNAA